MVAGILSCKDTCKGQTPIAGEAALGWRMKGIRRVACLACLGHSYLVAMCLEAARSWALDVPLSYSCLAGQADDKLLDSSSSG